LVIAHHGRLPIVGAVVDIVLPPDPARLVDDEPPPADVLHVEVKEIESYVPAEVRVTITRGNGQIGSGKRPTPTAGGSTESEPATYEGEEASGWVDR
jgi:hypothetical protein